MPNPGLSYPNPHGYDLQAATAIRQKAETTLILSAVSIFFCCLGGILATYVAYKAKQDANAGNLAAAEKGIKRATVYLIISFVFGGLTILARLITAQLAGH